VAAVEASFHSLAKAIIVLTNSGRSAHTISKYRPRCPIIAVTRNEITARQMHLWRGCFPILIREPKPDENLVSGELWMHDVDFRVNRAMETSKQVGFCAPGDEIVVVTGWRGGKGFTNTLRIIKCP
jgi:pyruvate kinase